MPNENYQEDESRVRMLGNGAARKAGETIMDRRRAIDAQLDQMMGVMPAMDSDEKTAKGKKKGKGVDSDAAQDYADGGRVKGPGGPKDDKVGPVMLGNTEYVLPGDTADAIGRDRLDAIRLATHDFKDKGEEDGLRSIMGLADGGSPDDQRSLPGGAGFVDVLTGMRPRPGPNYGTKLVDSIKNSGEGFVGGLMGATPPAWAAQSQSVAAPQPNQPPPGIAKPVTLPPASGTMMGVPLRYGAQPAPAAGIPGSADAVATGLAGVDATAKNTAPVPGLTGVQYAGNYGRTPTFRSTGSAGEPSFTDLRGLSAQGAITGDAAEVAAASERLADTNPQRTAQNIVPAGSLAGVSGPLSDALVAARQDALARGDTAAVSRSMMTSAQRDAADRQAAAYKKNPVEAYKADTLASVQGAELGAKQARQGFEDDRQTARDTLSQATERRRATAARESGIVQAASLADKLGGEDFQLGQFAASLVPYLADRAGDVPPSSLARMALEEATKYRAKGIATLPDLMKAAGFSQ